MVLLRYLDSLGLAYYPLERVFGNSDIFGGLEIQRHG
jgi:hypothetical protein